MVFCFEAIVLCFSSFLCFVLIFKLSFFFSFWRPTFICFSLGFWNLSMALSWVHLDPLKLFSSWKGLLQRSSCGWSESSALKKFVLYLMYVRQNWARLARLRQDGQSKMSSAASSQITCKYHAYHRSLQFEGTECYLVLDLWEIKRISRGVVLTWSSGFIE